MAIIKPAATILLGREREGKLEVLLVKRNKALKFAAGFWVFPGGKIEAEEIEQAADDLEAAKIAAVRETKEETNLDIDTKHLLFFRHWTTPSNSPRRFATWFFFGDLGNNSSIVKIDDNEIKEYLWIEPQKALEQVRMKKLAMLPPTYICLQLIHKCQTIAEVKTQLTKTEPLYTLPVVAQAKPASDFMRANMLLLYEGDAGYDTADPNLPGARHRLQIDAFKGEFNFEYRDCDNALPLNGGMHL